MMKSAWDFRKLQLKTSSFHQNGCENLKDKRCCCCLEFTSGVCIWLKVSRVVWRIWMRVSGLAKSLWPSLTESVLRAWLRISCLIVSIFCQISILAWLVQSWGVCTAKDVCMWLSTSLKFYGKGGPDFAQRLLYLAGFCLDFQNTAKGVRTWLRGLAFS